MANEIILAIIFIPIVQLSMALPNHFTFPPEMHKITKVIFSLLHEIMTEQLAKKIEIEENKRKVKKKYEPIKCSISKEPTRKLAIKLLCHIVFNSAAHR